jgi:hypothetical protein
MREVSRPLIAPGAVLMYPVRRFSFAARGGGGYLSPPALDDENMRLPSLVPFQADANKRIIRPIPQSAIRNSQSVPHG